MSNYEDPNFGMVGGDKDSFEGWGNDLIDLNNPGNFDLINFIGAEEEEYNDKINYGSTEQEEKQSREEKLYTTQQYNQIVFADYTNDMHYGQYQYGGAPNNGYEPVVDSSMIPTTSKKGMPIAIKQEPDYEQPETKLFDDSGAYSDGGYANSICSNELGTYDQDNEFKPKTKPRQYRVKPDEEKKNPTYKLKREKNNDAVRRSRDKAKQIQIEKEERLAFLEQEKVNLDRTIQQLKTSNKQLQQKIDTIKHHCTCGCANRF